LERPFLEDLVNPFIYITKVVQRSPEYQNTFAEHPENWSQSTHTASLKVSRQLPKEAITELTESVN